MTLSLTREDLATIPCPDGINCVELVTCDVCLEFVCGHHTGDARPCVNVGMHCSDDCASRCSACTKADKPCHRKDGVR